MNDKQRLIEHAFPLKEASIDSVHEKNVRHGHISSLHIWPARRPLAACRAALLATLLPDPGTPDKRRELCEMIGGKLTKRTEKKKMPNGQVVEREREETEGGILHWGRETENKRDLEWFRSEILKANGGRAPRVLDPFAGGGAIPLEAMRLGCEVTAVDINPVAWFILKCTLEYPQKLAGKTLPLPEFILADEEFMEAFYKAHPHLVGRTRSTKKQLEADRDVIPGWEKHRADNERTPKAGLAWHVRAWGRWVLARARKDLAPLYPIYADFEPLDTKNPKAYEKQPIRLVPFKKDGTPDEAALNRDFSAEYLTEAGNPRWVAKPTVAYMWARTVQCKNCRGVLPLLKTRWLARTTSQRVLLEMTAGPKGVTFAIRERVESVGSNAAQRREHDKRAGKGTMSRSGATCPHCSAIMTMEDIQLEGRAGRLGRMMTAASVQGRRQKQFRLPTEHERKLASTKWTAVQEAYEGVPFGVPTEMLVEDAKRNTWCVQYGCDQFAKLFTERQLVAMASIVRETRAILAAAAEFGYSALWREAIESYLACAISRLADYLNCGARWKLDRATINPLFVRYALPLCWDFVEGNVLGSLPGSFDTRVSKLGATLDTLMHWCLESSGPSCTNGSSITAVLPKDVDCIVTDPPYYNSIGYAVVMDYFYVWLRRILHGLSPEHDAAFAAPLTPKWNADSKDGELVDDSSRHGGDDVASKAAYEGGMEQVFRRCADALREDGRLVIVFAHKDPDAWGALVAAIIRSGFVVDGSWPIQTEQAARMRAQASAALASSVWLVCKKRPSAAKPGWDNLVLEGMRTNIRKRLREFWDAGIRGPDFVWAATGPALEAYSKHPFVKKANEPGQVLGVDEFLFQVRRMVVDFVVGRVLTRDDEGTPVEAESDRLDEPTAYYLLHRHDFGLDDAPAGACILYAVSCGLHLNELAATWDLISFSKGKPADEAEDDEPDGDDETEVEEDSGSKVKLKTWTQRKRKSLGDEAPGGRPVPLIDRIHRLMHLWGTGDPHLVDEYIDGCGLRRHELFHRVLQALIERADDGSEERIRLEAISNHLHARGAATGPTIPFGKDGA